jgi:uncharacterized secreted protein with C-terminal beta-propeller domain
LPGTFENPETKFKYFFERDPQRKLEGEPEVVMSQYINQVYTDIYIKYKNDCFIQNLVSAEKHPFLKLISDRKDMLFPEGGLMNKKSMDEVLYDYLKLLEKKTNNDYFLFAFKFIVLFRECMNKKYKDDIDRTKVADITLEYTELYNAENAPDLCNDFVIIFLEDAHYFGMNSEREKIALIDIIQHFCQWLFENGHTSSKLSLLNG